MKKIMVIDDDRILIKTLQHTTRNNKQVEMIFYQDAQIGLEMAKVHKPHLIIMDIVLDGMNGAEAVRLLHQDPQLWGIPVIFRSSIIENGQGPRTIKVGEQDYLAIPKTNNLTFFIERITSLDANHQEEAARQQSHDKKGTVNA